MAFELWPRPIANIYWGEVRVCSVLGLESRFGLTPRAHKHILIVQVEKQAGNSYAFLLRPSLIAPSFVRRSLFKIRSAWFFVLQIVTAGSKQGHGTASREK